MSYLGISIKEAMLNINNESNGWFLPEIQRPYVWGSRHENEIYICKLFDSILKGYPIGGLIVWNTKEEVPYREFVTNYNTGGDGPKLVEMGRWNKPDKWLIYDGQQRLQTLYSCLIHTFNDKVLIFDLLYDSKNDDQGETGFRFVPKNGGIKWHEIRMNQLFTEDEKSEKKVEYRRNVIALNPEIKSSDVYKIEENVEILWDVFVKKSGKNSLAYFRIGTDNKNEVNEIFERLNTGGMTLSLADILFSKIKDKHSGFEENLQVFSKKIYTATGNGYTFNAYNILQLLNLIIKSDPRIDPKKVKSDELKKYVNVWENLQEPLEAFFVDYIWGQFKINRNSIIPRHFAVLPIIFYFYEIYLKNKKFKNINATNLQTINQYFIKSQINDWNLTSYIENFTRIIREKSENSNGVFEFPLIEIENYIKDKKKRRIEIHEETFVDEGWFTLKILTPNRVYQFSPDMKNRYNPEIDHIFPKKLKDMPPNFPKEVDILWNTQPTKGEINGHKSVIHPKLFFTDKHINSKKETVVGSKYINDYDFLPSIDDKIWDDPKKFIEERRIKMINFLLEKYDIKLIEAKVYESCLADVIDT